MLSLVPSPVLVERPPNEDRRCFEQHLDRVRLRTMRAVARARHLADGERLETELSAVEQATAGHEDARDRRLARLLGLGPEELELVWLAVAVAANPLLTPHAIALGGADARSGATLALLAAVADLAPGQLRDIALALGSDHALLPRLGLLERAHAESTPAQTPLVASRRLVRHLAGDDSIDEVVAAAGGRVPIPAALVPDPEVEIARRRLALVIAGGEPLLIVLEGPDGAGRRTLLARGARDAGRDVVTIDLRRLAPGAQALAEALAGLAREQVLSGALPLVCGVDELGGSEADRARRHLLGRFVAERPGPVALATRVAGIELAVDRPILRVAVPVPDVGVRVAMWRSALGLDAATVDAAVPGLATRHRLGPGGIARAVAGARAHGAVSERTLAEGIRATVGDRFAGLARHVAVAHGPGDLVLPEDLRDQLDAVVRRVRHAHQVLEGWGLGRLAGAGGTAVLFSGPPGTGKTMAAGLLARALDLELYQVDLGAVVSKWVGETQKLTVAQVMQTAESEQAQQEALAELVRIEAENLGESIDRFLEDAESGGIGMPSSPGSYSTLRLEWRPYQLLKGRRRPDEVFDAAEKVMKKIIWCCENAQELLEREVTGTATVEDGRRLNREFLEISGAADET